MLSPIQQSRIMAVANVAHEKGRRGEFGPWILKRYGVNRFSELPENERDAAIAAFEKEFGNA